jgi:hypothetical protein
MPTRPYRPALSDDQGDPVRVVRDRTDTGPLKGFGPRFLRATVPFIVGALGLFSFVPFVYMTIRESSRAATAGSDVIPLLVSAVIIGLLCWAGVRVTREWFRRLDWQLYTTRRSLGRCGCCGFDLFALQPTPQGLVRCPECAHAWRPAPPTPPRPSTPPAPPSAPGAPRP